MEDKKLDEKSLEELAKAADAFRDFTTNLADKLSKVLADIKAYKEEDTWEMKCPYKDGNEYYFVSANGLAKYDSWDNYDFEKRAFAQGNIFKTQQEAELEVKRRNLLTRFRAFRDECNRDWKADWNDCNSKKWIITKNEEEIYAMWTNGLNNFSLFGHFKNQEDCERAIELFGDEIKELFVE